MLAHGSLLGNRPFSMSLSVLARTGNEARMGRWILLYEKCIRKMQNVGNSALCAEKRLWLFGRIMLVQNGIQSLLGSFPAQRRRPCHRRRRAQSFTHWLGLLGPFLHDPLSCRELHPKIQRQKIRNLRHQSLAAGAQELYSVRGAEDKVLIGWSLSNPVSIRLAPKGQAVDGDGRNRNLVI